MTRKILFVDDDPNILSGFRRQLHGRYELETAEGGAAGLVALEKSGPFAVVVADMRMPQMDGVHFLMEVVRRSPDSVRMMLTGNSDQHTAAEAVNLGSVFRFLSKPCPPADLEKALEAALAQYRLITAERELLENTLAGSVKVLTETLSLVNPAAFGQATRLRRYVRHMAQRLGLADVWRFDVAAMLSQIGCVALTSETLKKVYVGEALNDDEARAFREHPAVGARLIEKIPRLEPVARMIEGQRGDAGGPDPGDDFAVAMGASMLRTALALDTQLVRGGTLQEALATLRSAGAGYDADILGALETLELSDPGLRLKAVRLMDLTAGMVLDQDVRSSKGVLLVAKGQEVTGPVLQYLANFARGVGVVEPIRVLVPDMEGAAAAEAQGGQDRAA
jgi:CheY-like chemotaxis protein